jgi:Holliday junction resolvase
VRRYTGGKRRDANEAEIVEALRAYGAYVLHLSGAGAPDLLAQYRGAWFPLEVKSSKGRHTALQVDLKWPVVRTVDEALAAIGAKG